jgi:hypothetical protein
VNICGDSEDVSSSVPGTLRQPLALESFSETGYTVAAIGYLKIQNFEKSFRQLS